MPEIALIATSETPNRMPAAAPSMNPWCWRGAPIRGPMISSVPAAIMNVSNAIMPGTEKCELALCATGSVTPRSIRPRAVRPRPSHCRRPISTPRIRSAMTASSTTPPASTLWTSDSGATAIAATWKIQAPAAITIPIANSREPNSLPGRPQRPANVDRGRGARATVLVEEADVRRESAREREQGAEEGDHEYWSWSGSRRVDALPHVRYSAVARGAS